MRLVILWMVAGLFQGSTVGQTLAPVPPGDAPSVNEQHDFFERQIRPILLTRCVECHGPQQQEAEIRVDSRAALLAGDGNGPLIVPGDPEHSRLVQATSYEGEICMPPETKLPDKDIAAIREWVGRGAPWPNALELDSPDDAAARHWAFQPLKASQPPAVQDRESVKRELDRFVLARLESAGIPANPPAEPRTLIRRLHVDLIGLPPTPEEVASFLADDSPTAWETLVDRLLASPHFGERWGRYWLDLARYADTKGYVFAEDRNYKYAFLYRDWVIQAFNDDLPYDQFLMSQLAADLWTVGEEKTPLAAMGFLTLGRRFLNNPHDIIDDRIDVITRTTMGLTVACARCHDHKYDPIPTEDYYSLYGVLSASHEELLALEEPTAQYLEELQKRQAAVEAYAQGEAKQAKLNDLRRKVAEWMNSDEAPPQILVLRDPAEPPGLPRVFQRGNPQRPGAEVPRRFLKVVAGESRPNFTSPSGRLELAQAIVSVDNPLTARVWANRVWGHLLGRPLVETPSDFGLRSDPPSDPELLDYLATQLLTNGWSTKNLIREIVLSGTYRRASDYHETSARRDPENRRLWRANRRRLDLETMRDSMLLASGTLQCELFGPSVEITEPPFSARRTIYGHIDRQNLPSVFRTFDFASPDSHSPTRFTTTVPQQALFLMNHSFVWDQATALIRRPDIAALTDEQRIERLYQVLFSRSPDTEERAWGLEFVHWVPFTTDSSTQDKAWVSYAQTLMMSNEFMFID